MISGKIVEGTGGAIEPIASIKKIIVVMKRISKDGRPRCRPD